MTNSHIIFEIVKMPCVFIYVLMVSITYGCSLENDNIEPVGLIDVSPKFEVFLNDTIILFFNARPHMVIVNDVIMTEIQYSYHEKSKIGYYYVDFNISRFIWKPGQVTLSVIWTDEANRKSSTILYYNVIKRCCLPELLGSDPGNKAIDVDPIRLNKEGIKILFSEPLIIEKIELQFIADDKELQWEIATDPTDKNVLLLRPLPGNELGFGQKVVVRLKNVMDQAGNLYASNGIPDGILKLYFTTIKEGR